MAQNNRTFTFIRVDASGRDVVGSNVLRRRKPVTGRWRQLNAYECCNPLLVQSIDSTPASFSLTTVNFHLLCDGVAVADRSVVSTTTNQTTLITALNANFSVYGVFTPLSTTGVTLALHDDIAQALCPDGVLTFVIN